LLQALLVWLASVVFLLFVPWLVALPYLATHYAGARLTSEMLFADKTLVIILIAGSIPVHVLTLGLSWAIATRWGKQSPIRVLGLTWPIGFRIAKSAGLAIALLLASSFILYKFGGQETEIERIVRSTRAAALITAFLATVTAPLVEEVLYRGLLYPAVERVFGQVFAIIAVSSMFAGLHVWQYWPNFAAISSIAILSLVLTTVRARTRRLLPCVAIHLVFNGIQSLIIVFEPYLRALYQSWHPEAVGPGFINFLLGLSR
jgi:membrane protease YdiL (CAAX protease family)